jgi:Xaa-Pro aminopeptidase
MKAVKNPVTEVEGTQAPRIAATAAAIGALPRLVRPGGSRQATSQRSRRSRHWRSFRRQTGELKDVSFPTISGAGPNGAIVHYRVTREDQPPDRGRASSF